MKAVIYTRHSSDNQREESIEGQTRECTAFAEKNGITILRHCIDWPFSAKTDNCPEFQNMIKDSGKRLFDMIIVWKLDRFARNRCDSARHKADDDYLLTTKLFRGYCGPTSAARAAQPHWECHHYYKCVSAQRKRQECRKKSVRKEWIEDLAVNETMKMVMDDPPLKHCVHADEFTEQRACQPAALWTAIAGSGYGHSEAVERHPTGNFNQVNENSAGRTGRHGRGTGKQDCL